MYSLLFSLITPIAVVIIGVVTAPKAGAARGKLWLGLSLMVAGSIVSLIWQVIVTFQVQALVDSVGSAGFGIIAGVISVITSAFFIAGLAVVASAVTFGRHAVGQLDPTRPGAPPSSYQGTGYPPAGDQQPEPGSNPYTS